MGILKFIIHNDAFRDDPPEIYGWRVSALAFSACFGGMLFGMDTGGIGGILALPTFQAKYGMDDLEDVPRADLEANIVTTLQVGCFTGALAAGYLADRLGRRLALIVAALMAIIGVIFQCAAVGHLPPFFIGRFIAGLGVGSASMIAPLYISENSPRAIRGLITGCYQVMIVFGIMLSFWGQARLLHSFCTKTDLGKVNYGSLLHIAGAGQYITPLAMQGLPAVLLLACMFFCNESPRWLARQDRWEEALRVLATVRSLSATHRYVATEMQQITDQLEEERQMIGGMGFKSLMKEMWTIPGNRRRALLSVGVMISQQMTGTNAVNYYAPQIFRNLGLSADSVQLFATGIYGLAKLVFTIVFIVFLSDSLGRRKSLIYSSVVLSLCMLYVGLYVRISPPAPGDPVPPAGYVALAAIYVFASTFEMGWGPVCWTFVSEVPAARLRSVNVALAAATNWLFGIVIARSTPNMLATLGRAGYGTFIVFACFCATMGTFAYFCIPETKGLALEQMDELFGVTEWSKNVDNVQLESDPQRSASRGKDEGALQVEHFAVRSHNE